MIQNSTSSTSSSPGGLQSLITQGKPAARTSANPGATAAAGAPSEEAALASLGNEDFTAGVAPLEDNAADQATQTARQNMLAAASNSMLAQANLDPDRAFALLE